VYVALDDELGVIGFYSLSSSAVSLGELPEDLRRKLPQYPLVPVVLIGRLARDERVRGTGLGEFLIASAVRRIVSAAEQVAAYAILVDAKDEPAAAFYRRFGFLPDPAEPLRLFLPLTTAAKALDLV
jgi:GNAT superfamily N-acetyltransferase